MAMTADVVERGRGRRTAWVAGGSWVVAMLAVLGVTGAPLLVLVMAAIGLATSYFARPASARDVHDFATLSRLATTATTRRFIAHYLTTGRRLRLVLVLAGLVLPPLVGTALGSPNNRLGADTSYILLACMAGTLWAELALTRPAGRARVASLAPREPAGYLGRLLRWGPVVVGTLAAAGWAGLTFVPGRELGDVGAGQITEPPPASGPEIAAGVAFALLVPALVIATQRWIVRRPQPLSSPTMVAADDAVRAASVRNLAAVGTTLGLISLATSLFCYTQGIAVTAVDWAAGLGAVGCMVLALVAWWSRMWWRPVRRTPLVASPPPTPTPEGTPA